MLKLSDDFKKLIAVVAIGLLHTLITISLFIWGYGRSSIRFDGGKVYGYPWLDSMIDIALAILFFPTYYIIRYLGLGSLGFLMYFNGFLWGLLLVFLYPKIKSRRRQ